MRLIKVMMAVAGVALVAGCQPADTTGAASKSAAVAAPAKKDGGTTAQRNALRSARSYLDMSGFSRQGLIDQLSSSAGEGYSKVDATWAVDHLTVDWNEQAVRSGEAYMKMSGFSRSGLINRLSSSAGDKYTTAQATYAANKLGL